MKLEKLIWLLLFMSPIKIFGQKISGQVVNGFDKTPIFGVTIYSDGVPYAFSDQDGKFEIKNATEIKTLIFSHLAFEEKELNIEELKNESRLIQLNEKATMLEEVKIATSKNSLSLEDIIKKSSKNFIEHYEFGPYNVKASVRQIVMENNLYKGYIETDGLLYNFIPKQNNTFQFAYILPKEYRKTVEKLTNKDYVIKFKEMYNYFSLDHLRGGFFLNFQSANLSHPLFKKQRYSFKQLEDVVIDGVEYYQVQFFQKKGIHTGRDLLNVYGEMIISKDNYTIVKHKVSFDFDKSYSNEFEIAYTTNMGAILPSTVTSSTKMVGKKFKNQSVFFQTYLSLDNSKVVESKGIKLGYQVCYYLDALKYNPIYWQNKSQTRSTELIDNYLKTLSGKDFEEGANQKLLDVKSKFYTKEDEAFRIQQIKLHEEMLKNIKL